MKRKIIPYNPKLKELARQLRNKSTKSEIKLWHYLKGKQMYGYDFHRQKPLLDFIVDYYCYELNLVIELDGITHHFEDTQLKDTHKENTLKSMGLHIIRFLDEEVMDDIDNVLRTIEAYIKNFELNKHTPDPSLEGKFGE